MPSPLTVAVSPAWAATWLPSIAENRFKLASLDLALAALVAGRWAEYQPYTADGEPEQVVAHLRAMRDGQPDPHAVVRIPLRDISAGLGARTRSAVEGMVLKQRFLLNNSFPCYASAEIVGDAALFRVAPNRALVPAHRRFGRMLRGRGARNLLSDHAYAGLEPATMARFSTAQSAPVYARVRSWLHAPGDDGLPRSGVEQSEDGMHLRMTIPADDVPDRLGLWCRSRPSAVDGILQFVAEDLARVGYHVSVSYAALAGRRLDTATIILASIPKHALASPAPSEPDALGIVQPVPPRTGRFRPVSAKARRAATAPATARAEPPAPAPVRRTRMGAAIVSPVAPEPAIPHENPVEYAAPTPEPVAAPPVVEPSPVAEPAPRPVFKPRTYAPPVVPAPDPSALVVEWGDFEEGLDPHDGWGFTRDMEGDAELWRASEGLAHLDSHGEGFNFDRPPPGAPYLELPVEYTNGPATGPDKRPPWLVRHLSYRVSWWQGAWADRPQSAFAPTAATPIEPYAVWAPGMGAQPAHVTCLADIEAYKAKAWRRWRWIEIRSEIADLEEEGVDPDDVETLQLTMDRVGYDALDAEFGGQGAEPWNAHVVPPSMSPRDRYFSDLVTAKRLAARRLENAARNARYEAEKAAKAKAPV